MRQLYIKLMFVTFIICLVASGSTSAQEDSQEPVNCGSWDISHDSWSELEVIFNEALSQEDCGFEATLNGYTGYHLETGLEWFEELITGGHTLELAIDTYNAEMYWQTGWGTSSEKIHYLTPGLTADLKALPIVTQIQSTVTINSGVSPTSATIDLGIFIINTLVSECLIPETEVVGAVMLNSHNLVQLAQLLLQGKYFEASQEFGIVIETFVSNALTDVGTDCALDVLSQFLGVRHLGLLADVIIWSIAVGPYHTWLLEGQLGELVFSYTPDPTLTSLVIDFETAPGDDGVLGTSDDIQLEENTVIENQFSALGIRFYLVQGGFPIIATEGPPMVGFRSVHGPGQDDTPASSGVNTLTDRGASRRDIGIELAFSVSSAGLTLIDFRADSSNGIAKAGHAVFLKAYDSEGNLISSDTYTTDGTEPEAFLVELQVHGPGIRRIELEGTGVDTGVGIDDLFLSCPSSCPEQPLE